MLVANHIIDHALWNALQWQSTPEVILKPDQRSVIVKFVCGHIPTRFVKSICFQMLLFALIPLRDNPAHPTKIVYLLEVIIVTKATF